jgi:heme-degrading monooxygenase HmoA
VAYFVAIHQEAWPDRVGELLSAIRHSLASASALHPGRRTTRLFQRLGRPTQLVSVSEWRDEAAFEELRQSAQFVKTNVVCGPPPRIDPLVPLRRFERMEQRIAVASCVSVTASVEQLAAVRAYMLRDADWSIATQTGLISREVYQVRDEPRRFLIVRGWSSMADLERFRRAEAAEHDEVHRRLGSNVERFTGSLAAELSVFDR